MKKKEKNFWKAVAGAVLFFSLSLILQYYFSIVTANTTMIVLATLNGLIGFLITIGTLQIKSKWPQLSIGFSILKVIVVFMAFAYLLILSTIGNPVLNNIATICFLVGTIVSILCLLILSFKELAQEYKKYKET